MHLVSCSEKKHFTCWGTQRKPLSVLMNHTEVQQVRKFANNHWNLISDDITIALNSSSSYISLLLFELFPHVPGPPQIENQGRMVVWGLWDEWPASRWWRQRRRPCPWACWWVNCAQTASSRPALAFSSGGSDPGPASLRPGGKHLMQSTDVCKESAEERLLVESVGFMGKQRIFRQMAGYFEKKL